MALHIGALRLPLMGRSAPAAVAERGRQAQAAAPSRAGLPAARRLRMLTGLLLLLLAVDGVIVALDARQATVGTVYVATVGKIRMLSQRLAKAAQQASQGNLAAFAQLRQSRDEFAALVKLLRSGGSAGGVELPPTAGAARPALDALESEWSKSERNAALVIGEQQNLVALGQAVRRINANNPALQELADEIAALSVQTGGSARQNAITAQLMMLTQRMAKNANTMLAGDIVDPEVAFLLGKDTNTFRDTLQGLLKGSETLRIAEVRDPETKAKLSELEVGFREYQRAVSDILGNMQRLVNAKRATRDIFNDSEALLLGAERLESAYQEELAARQVNFLALAAVSALALFVLLLTALLAGVVDVWSVYADGGVTNRTAGFGSGPATQQAGAGQRFTSPGGDQHDMWIDPTNANRMIVGNDQNVAVSTTRGRTWLRANPPIAPSFSWTAGSESAIFPTHPSSSERSSVSTVTWLPEIL